MSPNARGKVHTCSACPSPRCFGHACEGVSSREQSRVALTPGVANNVTEWASEQSALMGLAFGSASTDLNTPWWEEQSKNWTDRRFGLYLARTQNWTDAVYNPNPQGGSLTLG